VEYCSFGLSSEVAIPELGSDQVEGVAYLAISYVPAARFPRSHVRHRWIDGSETLLSVAKVDRRYLVELDDGRVFSFDPDTRAIGCPRPLDSTGRHQLLDHVLPRVLDHLGHLMIHAGAVCTAHGVIVFIGDTGAGKSSLVASFLAAGFEILSDDGVRLTVGDSGDVECIPTYRSLRLWPDSADALVGDEPFEPMSAGGDKRRLTVASPGTTSRSDVAAICVLAVDAHDPEAVGVSPLRAARAVSLLLAQCFRLDPTDAAATRRTFDRCADVVERVPVVELGYPRDYARLSEVRDAVVERAATGNWPTFTQE
jgi:hypothetical protein